MTPSSKRRNKAPNSAPTPKDLTEEKGLWEVYRRSIRIRRQPAAIWFALANALVAIIGLLVLRPKVHAIAEAIRAFADKGLEYSIGLIGLLVAGFTFYAALGDKKLFIEMAQKRDRKTGLTYFKYFMFTFLKQLSELWFLLVLYLLILLFGGKNGFMSEMLRLLPDAAESKIRYGIASVVLLGLLFLTTYIIASLASFIFNIYYVIAFETRWIWQRSKNRKNRTNSRNPSDA